MLMLLDTLRNRKRSQALPKQLVEQTWQELRGLHVGAPVEAESTTRRIAKPAEERVLLVTGLPTATTRAAADAVMSALLGLLKDKSVKVHSCSLAVTAHTSADSCMH